MRDEGSQVGVMATFWVFITPDKLSKDGDDQMINSQVVPTCNLP